VHRAGFAESERTDSSACACGNDTGADTGADFRAHSHTSPAKEEEKEEVSQRQTRGDEGGEEGGSEEERKESGQEGCRKKEREEVISRAPHPSASIPPIANYAMDGAPSFQGLVKAGQTALF
jgi:hypothetical protein